MNIISNDCTAGFIYREINEEFKNPFIWTSIDIDNFIKLIENYDTLNFNNISIKLELNTSKISVQNEKYPIITIDNKVDIHYFHHFQKEGIHSELNTEERYIYDEDIINYVKQIYFSRISRMTESPIFIWSNFEEYSWYNSKDIEKLKNVSTKYKLIIYSNSSIKNFSKDILIIKKPFSEILVEKNAISLSDYFKRTLIYTCCDEKYSHFIPLFCAALLYSNKNIDIEIGTSVNKLTDAEENALIYLRKVFPNSKILIKYNYFKVVNNIAIYNNNKMFINTVRFISEPIIKDYYTYISDIDLIMLDKNFYVHHIKILKDNNIIYDNIVRKNNPTHLSGLHFCITEKWYPLNLTNIDYKINDEEVLMNIAKNKTSINHELVLRPQHGIHMSFNRPEVKAGKIIGWGAEPYKIIWNEFINTEIYKTIELSFHSIIIDQINKLNKFYKNF